ncbi:unnamed protein product [Pedinophyceae sp. YPF-701]|nr:unnamed protein product [Pedinophyceae sp. YPF-701]
MQRSVEALLRDLQAVQHEPTHAALALSERAAADLVAVLKSLDLLPSVVIGRGRIIVTEAHLREEVLVAAERAGGRCSVDEIADSLELDRDAVLRAVDQIGREGTQLIENGGELITQAAWERLGREARHFLHLRGGAIPVPTVCAKLKLTVGLTMTLLEQQVQLSVRDGWVYSDAHRQGQEARVRGALRGCLRPTRRHSKVDPTGRIATELVRRGDVAGSLAEHVYTPKVWASLLRDIVSAAATNQTSEGVRLRHASIHDTQLHAAFEGLSDDLEQHGCADIAAMLPSYLSPEDLRCAIDLWRARESPGDGVLVTGSCVVVSRVKLEQHRSRLLQEARTAADLVMRDSRTQTPRSGDVDGSAPSCRPVTKDNPVPTAPPAEAVNDAWVERRLLEEWPALRTLARSAVRGLVSDLAVDVVARFEQRLQELRDHAKAVGKQRGALCEKIQGLWATFVFHLEGLMAADLPQDLRAALEDHLLQTKAEGIAASLGILWTLGATDRDRLCGEGRLERFTSMTDPQERTSCEEVLRTMAQHAARPVPTELHDLLSSRVGDSDAFASRVRVVATAMDVLLDTATGSSRGVRAADDMKQAEARRPCSVRAGR